MALSQLRSTETARPASRPSRPSDEIVAFVEQVLDRETEGLLQVYGHDKRTERRYRIALPVLAVPIDANLQPLGASFVAVTRNISTRGIALLTSKLVRAKFLAVKLNVGENQQIQAAIEILRCKPFGPFFEVGGTFVAKIYGRPNLGFDVDEGQFDLDHSVSSPDRSAPPIAGSIQPPGSPTLPAGHSSNSSDSTQA